MAKKYRGSQEETSRASSRRTFLRHLVGTSVVTASGIVLLPRLTQAGKPGQLPQPGTAGKPGEIPTGGTTGGQVGGSTTGGQVGGTTTGGQVGGAQGGDLEVLNFALLLERLEAAFYNQNAGKAYLTQSGGVQKGPTLIAQLSGAAETPPVNTTASGTGTFELSVDQTMLSYSVQVTGLSGPATAMHIHRGTVGVAGDIVYTLATPVDGAAVGATPINPADLNALLNQGMYLNVHTALNPGGEVRGQLVVTQTPGTGTGTGTTTLQGIVNEIREHENAHVALLEQTLGANAQPAPTFKNLDAPTLQQFLTMAQMLEDVGVSAYLGQLPLIQDKTILATAAGIMAVEGRHAGGLRAYRKGASTADGGDPNITLTEDREAVNRARTREQVLAAIQPFVATPSTDPGTTTGGTVGGTTTGGTTTGGTTSTGGTIPPY
jgi:hypothetical protein